MAHQSSGQDTRLSISYCWVQFPHGSLAAMPNNNLIKRDEWIRSTEGYRGKQALPFISQCTHDVSGQHIRLPSEAGGFKSLCVLFRELTQWQSARLIREQQWSDSIIPDLIKLFQEVFLMKTKRWRRMKSNFDMRVSSNGRMAVSKTAHASSILATRALPVQFKG